MSGEALKLGSRSLFETINGLVKSANMLRQMRSNITRWLRHVNLFLENSMEKGISNIQLLKRPIIGDC